jgi:hypothetical protein
MPKPVKTRKGKSTKLHLEIPLANWARIEAYLKDYNENEERMTPRIKVAHVVNMALEQYLRERMA